jgi:hypothetical protein
MAALGLRRHLPAAEPAAGTGGLYRYQDIAHVGVNGLTSAARGKTQTGAVMLNLF